MKPIKSLLVIAMMVVPGVAAAQGYYGGGPGYNQPSATTLPGGFHNRQGRLAWGGDIGLGAMNDDIGDIDCANCSDVSFQIAGHIGGFIGPRLALMGEVQGNAQTLSVGEFGDTETLVQSALMIAAQYWLTPQFWIKGGIGFANLRVDWSAYGDGIVDESTRPENGLALLGAAGFELMSARDFSVDIQGRILNGSYDAIDNNITGLSIGVGINFY
jgi:hypothetical protein